MTTRDAAIVDIDGTLVDSSYHHIVAWHRAFTRAGVAMTMPRLHSFMGMGGDKLVGAAAGDEVEERQGDEIRRLWQKEYDHLLGEVRAFDGATELLEALERAGLKVVLATSGHPSHSDRTLDIIGVDQERYAIATSGDAPETKPAPDLIELAMEKVGAASAIVIGDTVWDVQAASKAGQPCLALLTGGYSRCALKEAGAFEVYDDPRHLISQLEEALRS